MAHTPEQKRRYAEQKRKRYAEDPEYRTKALQRQGRYRQAHREQILEKAKIRRRQPGGKTLKEYRRAELVVHLWHEQRGCCYLCNKQIPLEQAVLEHDHRCCPVGSFCRTCIRGISHQECNKVIGHAGDDPDLLETLARNLRAKLAEMDERLASKPQQPTLDDVA